MPVYEYQCDQCQEIFTKERKVKDRKRRAKCTHCGSFKTTLKISSCGFVLMGGGWADTGYSAGKKKTKK